MSILKQILVLMVLSAVAYGGYAGYGHWKASNAATPPEAAKQAGGKPAKRKFSRGKWQTLVETGTAEIRTISRTVDAVGNTRAIRYVDIKPKADGTIKKMHTLTAILTR